jgi:hypothetical protein
MPIRGLMKMFTVKGSHFPALQASLIPKSQTLTDEKLHLSWERAIYKHLYSTIIISTPIDPINTHSSSSTMLSIGMTMTCVSMTNLTILTNPTNLTILTIRILFCIRIRADEPQMLPQVLLKGAN